MATGTQQEKLGSKTCDICDSHKDVIWYCQSCQEILCNQCLTHHMRTISGNHTVTQLSQTDEENKSTLTFCPDHTNASTFCPDHTIASTCCPDHTNASTFCPDHTNASTFCPDHKHEAFQLYCTTCDCLVCLDCVIGKHKGHDYERIKNTVKQNKTKLKEGLHMIKTENEVNQDALEVHKVKQDPLEVHKVNQDPLEVHKVNQNALEVHKVKQDPLEVHKVNQDHLEVHKVNQDALEVHKVNQDPLEVHKVNQDAREVHKVNQDLLEVCKVNNNHLESCEVNQDTLEVCELNNNHLESCEVNQDTSEVCELDQDPLEVCEVKRDHLRVSEVNQNSIEALQVRRASEEVCETSQDHPPGEKSKTMESTLSRDSTEHPDEDELNKDSMDYKGEKETNLEIKPNTGQLNPLVEAYKTQHTRVTIGNIVSSFKWQKDLWRIKMLNHNEAWLLKGHPSSRDQCLEIINDQGKHMTSISLRFSIWDMAATASGNLLVTTTGGQILRIRRSGGRTGIFANLSPYKLYGIHVTRSGNVLVGMSDGKGRGMIKRLASWGDTLQVIRNVQKNFYLYGIYHITENMNYDIVMICNWNYIGDWRYVLVVDILGRYRFRYTGQTQIKLAEDFYPTDIICNQSAQILVADRNNHTIHVLDKDGTFLRLIFTEDHGVKSPTSLAIDGTGKLWVGCLSGEIFVLEKLS